MELYEPHIHKTTTVSTDPSKHPHIMMNLDVRFPGAPCWLLEIGMKTGVSSMDEPELQRMLTFQHIDKDEKIVHEFPPGKNYGPFENIDLESEKDTMGMLENFYKGNHECRVSGTLSAAKVTG